MQYRVTGINVCPSCHQYLSEAKSMAEKWYNGRGFDCEIKKGEQLILTLKSGRFIRSKKEESDNV